MVEELKKLGFELVDEISYYPPGAKPESSNIEKIENVYCIHLSGEDKAKTFLYVELDGDNIKEVAEVTYEETGHATIGHHHLVEEPVSYLSKYLKAYENVDD